VQRNYPPNLAYDHYVSEILLLYCCRIALQEVNDIRAMVLKPPAVGLTIPDLPALEGVNVLSAYLWFLGGHPHAYDRYNDANERCFAEFRKHNTRTGFVRPEELEEGDVRYYTDPLSRLVRLHSSSHEMITGYAFRSPWERDDARFR
jgi:hypothetical protein